MSTDNVSSVPRSSIEPGDWVLCWCNVHQIGEFPPGTPAWMRRDMRWVIEYYPGDPWRGKPIGKAVSNMKRLCHNCRRTIEEHVKEHCLFSSTVWR